MGKYGRILISMILGGLLGGVGLLSIATGGEDYVVEQKDKEFIYKGAKVATLKIKVGEVVHFKNSDPYFHNVFSLSDVKMFDLGSYPAGQSRSVTFEKAGKVQVECAIHPMMRMVIEVR